MKLYQLTALYCLWLTGCALGGLPAADGYTPPKPPERCIWVYDQYHAACLTPEAFQRWRKRNGI